MKVKEKDEHIIVIKKSSETTQELAEKIMEQYHSFSTKNLVIDLHEEEVRPSTIVHFEELAHMHLNNKKSFVIVATIDFDEMDDAIIIVPTIQEAFDIIQMEEIERDLGF